MLNGVWRSDLILGNRDAESAEKRRGRRENTYALLSPETLHPLRASAFSASREKQPPSFPSATPGEQATHPFGPRP
jgi:hypothetical protein